MEIHKDLWIEKLQDSSDTTEVKQQFIKSLGFHTAKEASDFLIKAEQTTFVGSWFLTDKELEDERKAHSENKVSVFSTPYPNEDGSIIVLKNEVSDQLEGPDFVELAKMFSDMGNKSPEVLGLALQRLRTIIDWAVEEGTSKEESIQQLICETLLELVRDNAKNYTKTIVLLELAGSFIYQQQTKDAPAPFYVKTIGEA